MSGANPARSQAVPPLKAVILAAHPWSGVPYGLHHIARGLARLGWEVLYVEPYFSPLHLAGGRRRGRVLSSRPRSTEQAGVSVLSPFTLIPHSNLPVLRSSATLRLAKYASWPFIGRRPLSGTPFSVPDLVICGSPTLADVALTLNAKVSLYRLADDSKLFSTLPLAARQAEISAIPSFDGVIVTSDLLETQARQAGARRVLLVSNGVDKSFFARPARPPRKISELPTPRILYAGAMEHWFDWPLLGWAAKERPNYSFVLVGRPPSTPPSDLPPNVHIIGPMPYSEMPALMQASTVGIIPFSLPQSEEAIRAINPLKLYEYLAAGAPVVSFVRPPSLNCEGLFVYSTRAQFLRHLDEATTLRERGARITAPQTVDWAEIVKTMLEKIGLPHAASIIGA